MLMIQSGPATTRPTIMVKDISHGSKAFKIDGLFGVILKILSKPDNEIIHGAGGGSLFVSPTGFQKFAS